MSRQVFSVAAMAILALALDQVTKWFVLSEIMQPPRVIPVTDFFNLTLGFNTGVSFGLLGEILRDYPYVLAAFTGAVVVMLFIWALWTQHPWERNGLALICGGALGNTVDRWRQGAVTDFLDFHWLDWHWPTFNVADVLIFAGVACVLLGAVSGRKSDQPAEKS
ncbi:MAG TPA: signal peptidase II [Lacipirellulaceae bacterium]|nr:signal peptidase II [Lacipirellulaceae bacterium]